MLLFTQQDINATWMQTLRKATKMPSIKKIITFTAITAATAYGTYKLIQRITNNNNHNLQSLSDHLKKLRPAINAQRPPQQVSSHRPIIQSDEHGESLKFTKVTVHYDKQTGKNKKIAQALIERGIDLSIDDTLVSVEFDEKPENCPKYLPVKLFKGKKEGTITSITLDGKNIALRIYPTAERSKQQKKRDAASLRVCRDICKKYNLPTDLG